MTVRFVFRPSKVFTTRGSIQCRITVNGQRSPAFATGIELKKSEWNPRLQQIKGRDQRAQTDNDTLDRIRGKLVNIYNYYDTHNMSVTAGMIKEVYAGRRSVQFTLIQLVDMFLAAERLRVGAGDKQISAETYRGKANRLSHVKDWFSTGGRQHLPAVEVKRGVVVEWIVSLERCYKHNYVCKHVDILHEVLDWGVLHDHIPANKITGFRYVREKPTRPEYLTVDEITRLENHVFPPMLSLAYNGRLEKVRDMLLMMCAVGMHYSDYAKLSSADLREYDTGTYIVILRTKTKREAIVPLSPLARRVISKYGSLETLPRPGNAQANDLVKLVAAQCGIDKPKISTKYGRRSFTDYYLNEMGWPMEKLLKMLGLTSSQYISHYGELDHRSLRLGEGDNQL